MAPLRRRLESLSFTDVESYGMSGNFFITAERSPRPALERQIAVELGAAAFVRSPAELAATAEDHPFRGTKGAAVMFLAGKPSLSAHAALAALDCETAGTTAPRRRRLFRPPNDDSRPAYAAQLRGDPRSCRDRALAQGRRCALRAAGSPGCPLDGTRLSTTASALSRGGEVVPRPLLARA